MLPTVINPNAFGQPTFQDQFDLALDAGPDLTAKTAKHKWRTIHKPLERNSGAQGIYGDASICADPILSRKGYIVMQVKRLSAALKAKWGREYLAPLLTTKFSFAQQYGYFEINAKLPAGKGMWPAFWLMPTKGQWPTGGEIDVMEALGVNNVYYASVHAKPDGTPLHKTTTVKLPDVDLFNTFHRYGVAWDKDEIVWYFDRKEVARRPTPADVHVPMYLILNVAAGGSWPGMIPADVKLPAQFIVERVSVWQLT